MEINADQIIQDLKKIADKIEKKNPGYKERVRREFFTQDASIFEVLDGVEIEILEKDKSSKT